MPTFGGNRGQAGDKAGGTTVGVQPSQAIPVGAVLIVDCVSDNFTTGDGETNQHSQVTDSQGNTYTKLREETEDGGAAAAGVTLSKWISQLGTALGTGDTVTLTLANAVTARGISLDEWSVGAGNTYQVDAVAGQNRTGAGGSGTDWTVTADPAGTSGWWSGLYGREDETNMGGGDADYTSTGAQFGSGVAGASATNVVARGAYRLADLGVDTFDGTFASGDWAAILVALSEVSGGGTPHSRTLTDALGLDDSEVRTAASSRTASDALGLIDPRTQAAATSRAPTDALGILDPMARTAAVARAVIDPLGLLDPVQRIAASVRSATDPLGFLDQLEARIVIQAVLGDALGLSDVLAAAQEAHRALQSALGLSDPLARSVAAQRAVVDALGLVDGAAGGQVAARILADALAVGDELTAVVAGAAKPGTAEPGVEGGAAVGLRGGTAEAGIL